MSDILFQDQIRSDEREACAQRVEQFLESLCREDHALVRAIAQAIRNRQDKRILRAKPPKCIRKNCKRFRGLRRVRLPYEKNFKSVEDTLCEKHRLLEDNSGRKWAPK